MFRFKGFRSKGVWLSDKSLCFLMFFRYVGISTSAGVRPDVFYLALLLSGCLILCTWVWLHTYGFLTGWCFREYEYILELAVALIDIHGSLGLAWSRFSESVQPFKCGWCTRLGQTTFIHIVAILTTNMATQQIPSIVSYSVSCLVSAAMKNMC